MLNNIDKEIADTTAKLAELEKQKVQLLAEMPEVRVALALHDEFCHYNHTDSCGWLYEIHDGKHDWTGGAHSRYLDKAGKVLTYKTEQEVYDLLNGYKRLRRLVNEI